MRRLAPLLALLLASPAVAQTVSAEGSETVRLKPDTARVYVTVEAAAAADAEERAEGYATDVADDVRRLKLKGAKVEVGPAVRRTESAAAWCGVTVTVADADPKVLAETADRVRKEVGTSKRVAAVTVSYSRSDTSDDGSAAGLAKATKKATARAEAIAAGLGMKLGPVQAAEEIPPLPDSDKFADGEIVRTVKVRVLYTLAK